jgi:hypothetical protein
MNFLLEVIHPGVNFINNLRLHFLYKILAPPITKLCFGFETFWHQNFVQKAGAKNLDKIDGRYVRISRNGDPNGCETNELNM